MIDRSEDILRRTVLFQAQTMLCFYCQQPMLEHVPRADRRLRLRQATLDHLTPFAHGGTRGFHNEVAACWGCNQARGTQSWLLFFCLKEIERANKKKGAAA